MQTSYICWLIKTIIGFSKCFCQFGKLLYVMVWGFSNRFIGECSWYFRCLCVVYWFVNAFVHQNMNDVIHKNSKICIYGFNYHKKLWQFGKHHLEKLECLLCCNMRQNGNISYGNQRQLCAYLISLNFVTAMLYSVSRLARTLKGNRKKIDINGS